MPDHICGRCKRPLPPTWWDCRDIVFVQWQGTERSVVSAVLCPKCEARWAVMAQDFLSRIPPEDLLDLCGLCSTMAEGVEPVAIALGHGAIPTTVQCCAPCRARVYGAMHEIGVPLS